MPYTSGGFQVLDYIAGAGLGLLAGFVFYRFAIIQIAKRTEDTQKRNALKKTAVLIPWLIVYALLFATIVWREDGLFKLKTVEYFIYTAIVLNIAAVDYLIRKIPNELLLILLLTKTVFLVLSFERGSPVLEMVMGPLIGLVIGFFIFSIPSMFRVMIGAGDVKFAAVIGFCLGYLLFFQAMATMAVIMMVFLSYLLATKKGTLKTATAMGPYLSVGVVLTMVFPISEIIIRVWESS
jgi:Flp pilus assembly protein protease CpaA